MPVNRINDHKPFLSCVVLAGWNMFFFLTAVNWNINEQKLHHTRITSCWLLNTRRFSPVVAGWSKSHLIWPSKVGPHRCEGPADSLPCKHWHRVPSVHHVSCFSWQLLLLQLRAVLPQPQSSSWLHVIFDLWLLLCLFTLAALGVNDLPRRGSLQLKGQ